MLLASNTGAGQSMGFPDVCNTPQPAGTVPIPYPNIAMNAQASTFSQIVRVSGMNALNMSSKISMTSGDEAGVAHPFIKQMAGYTMGNPLVSIEKQPAIHLTCPTNGNNMNCSVGVVAVPSVTTVFYTMLPTTAEPESTGEYQRQLDTKDLDQLGEKMAHPVVSSRRLDQGVGYVALARFTPSVPTWVFRALRQLGGDELTALVLDLRGNVGGDTQAMTRLADDFLPRDATIFRRIGSDGDELVVRARQADPYTLPVVILVDAQTASAAELFAGCMQHHRRAQIVGEHTFGKGQMQRVVPDVAGQGVWYADVASCRLPDGTELEGHGIEPDWLVVADPACQDAQLAAACRIALGASVPTQA